MNSTVEHLVELTSEAKLRAKAILEINHFPSGS
jgi:hypothetical protein